MVDMEWQAGVLLPDVSGNEPERAVPGSEPPVLGDDANAQHLGTSEAGPPGGLSDQGLAVPGTTGRWAHREMSQLPDARLTAGRAREGTAQQASSGVDSAVQGEAFGDDCSQVVKAPEGRIIRGVGCSDAELRGYGTESLVLDVEALRIPRRPEVDDVTQRRCSFHTLSTNWAHNRPKSQP